MIRKFFTFLIIVGLMGLSIYNYWQVQQLKQSVAVLEVKNSQLTKDLLKHKSSQYLHEIKKTAAVPFDPVQDAQLHLTKAEAALGLGNVGNAVSECKLAEADIQTASSSTSSNVRTNLGNLKDKLDSVQQQTTSLWRKLGV